MNIFKFLRIMFCALLLIALYLFVLNGRYKTISDDTMVLDRWTGKTRDITEQQEKTSGIGQYLYVKDGVVHVLSDCIYSSNNAVRIDTLDFTGYFQNEQGYMENYKYCNSCISDRGYNKIIRLLKSNFQPFNPEKIKYIYNAISQNGNEQDYTTFVQGFLDKDNYGHCKEVYDILKDGGADVGTEQEFIDWLKLQSAKPTPSRNSTMQR